MKAKSEPGKLKVAVLLVVPAMLAVFDVASTYYIVCMHGGTEINDNAVRLAQRFGYGGLSAMILSVSLVFGAALSFIYVSLVHRRRLSWAPFVLLAAYIVFSYGPVVALNANAVVYVTTGEHLYPPELIVNFTAEEAAQKIGWFNERRDGFCRIL